MGRAVSPHCEQRRCIIAAAGFRSRLTDGGAGAHLSGARLPWSVKLPRSEGAEPASAPATRMKEMVSTPAAGADTYRVDNTPSGSANHIIKHMAATHIAIRTISAQQMAGKRCCRHKMTW